LKIDRVIRSVEKTHPRLGNMTAVNLIAALARRCLVNIAPSGCGKSSVTNTLLNKLQPSLRTPSMTKSALRHYKDRLSGYVGLLVMDDLGAIDTEYSLIGTVSCLADLAYTHQAGKAIGPYAFQITNFHGSILLNVQPVVWRKVVRSDAWESVVRDKVIRYYHLYRPLEPVSASPDIPDVDWVKPAEFPDKLYDTEAWRLLKANFEFQHSEARAREHAREMARALAGFEGLKKVSERILEKLEQLTRPMLMEAFLMTKRDLESGRDFNHNLLCLLVEFASYGRGFELKRMCRDHQLSEKRLRQILQDYTEYAVVKMNRVYPTERTCKMLSYMGVDLGEPV